MRNEIKMFQAGQLVTFVVSGNFGEFSELVKKAGFEAILCSPDHFQIIGGKFLVNYYPNGRKGPKIYVGGTNEGFFGGDAEAIQAARELPSGLPKDSRKHQGHYKKARRSLLKKTKICSLCHQPVKPDEASIDHVIPLSRGGLNNRNNYQLAHKTCNMNRGSNV